MSDHIRRPRTEHIRVEDLVLDDVPSGRFRIPRFQRPWRWTRDDVLDLFDSLWRGYPIGVILCWTRDAEAETIQMGEFSCEVAARSNANLVIDGQQRIRALVGVLRNPGLTDTGRRGTDFELYFDLHDRRFCHRDTPRPPPSHWLPMRVVARSSDLSEWLDERSLRRDQPGQYRVALELGRMIREHELLLYVVNSEDEGAIRQLFARLNNMGRRLRETEVFDALHRGMGGPIDDLTHLALETARAGFGVMKEERLLQVCLAIHGAEFRRKLEGRLHRTPPEKARLEGVKPALFAALGLLREHADLPSGNDIPHALALNAIAILCARFPDIAPRNADLLSRFVWRGAATEALNGRNQELAARVYGEARRPGADQHACVQGLLSLVPRSEPSPFSIGSWNPNRGFSRLILRAMEVLMPRDLQTLRTLGFDELRPEGKPLQAIPIFNQAQLPGLEWRRSIGNLLLHPAPGGLRYLSPLLKDLARPSLFRDPALFYPALESHSIPPQAWEAFLEGHTEAFLSLREAALKQRVREFIAVHARWDDQDRDRPPLDAIIGGADED